MTVPEIDETPSREPLKAITRESRLSNYRTLQHTEWECKYHIVFIPKYRRTVLYWELRKHLGEILRRLARQKECEIEEGHLMPDHVHIMISIPPKYTLAQVMGHMKGKSAIHIAHSSAGFDGTSLDSALAHEVILYQRSGETKKSFGGTSSTRRSRIADRIS